MGMGALLRVCFDVVLVHCYKVKLFFKKQLIVLVEVYIIDLLRTKVLKQKNFNDQSVVLLFY